MSGSKPTVILIAALTLLSIDVVLYPQAAANPETRYCAKPTKETEPTDCSISNIKDCRASLKEKGGGRCYKQ